MTIFVIFFDSLGDVSNIISVSPKRIDHLRQKQLEKVIEGFGLGKIKMGKGLNQEGTLKRPGDTRWGSHYGTIMSVINLFSSVSDVLDFIFRQGSTSLNKIKSKTLKFLITSLSLCFYCT